MKSTKYVSSWDSFVFIARCFVIFLIGAVAQSADDAPSSKVSADDGTSAIEYGLDVDPGGMLPDWMMRSTVQSTLIDTIKALEAQVEKTKSQYSLEISKLAEDSN